MLSMALARAAMDAGFELTVAPAALCTDNGAMVAWAGLERLELGMIDGLDAAARARWPLDKSRQGVPGAKA
jgi:N6-L-threonylcarbamoyladenine synthase